MKIRTQPAALILLLSGLTLLFGGAAAGRADPSGHAQKISGGLDFASAKSVDLEQRYRQASPGDVQPRFFVFQVRPNNFISLTAQAGSKEDPTPTVTLYDASHQSLGAAVVDACPAPPCAAEFGRAYTGSGPALFFFSVASAGAVDFSLSQTELYDAGSGRDAGEKRAGAINLTPGQTYSAYLTNFADSTDTFSVPLPQGLFVLKIRPDAACRMKASVLNQVGDQVDYGRTLEAGQALLLDGSAKSAGTFFIVVDSDGPGDICSYNFIIGGSDVPDPAQPRRLRSR